jgi:hypothetical protein
MMTRMVSPRSASGFGREVTLITFPFFPRRARLKQQRTAHASNTTRRGPLQGIGPDSDSVSQFRRKPEFARWWIEVWQRFRRLSAPTQQTVASKLYNYL